MLEINFEFRKGIFFIRLIGDLDNNNYIKQEQNLKELIEQNKFKYVVINTNYLEKIDLNGINYLIELFYMAKINSSSLIICDKSNTFKRLLKGSIPNIEEEIEVL